MTSVLLQDIQDQIVLFFVADAAYDSQYIYEIARICNIFDINLINPRNGEQIKSTHRRVLSYFVQTIFDKQLGLRQPTFISHLYAGAIAYSASFSDS